MATRDHRHGGSTGAARWYAGGTWPRVRSAGTPPQQRARITAPGGVGVSNTVMRSSLGNWPGGNPRQVIVRDHRRQPWWGAATSVAQSAFAPGWLRAGMGPSSWVDPGYWGGTAGQSDWWRRRHHRHHRWPGIASQQYQPSWYGQYGTPSFDDDGGGPDGMPDMSAGGAWSAPQVRTIRVPVPVPVPVPAAAPAPGDGGPPANVAPQADATAPQPTASPPPPTGAQPDAGAPAPTENHEMAPWLARTIDRELEAHGLIPGLGAYEQEQQQEIEVTDRCATDHLRAIPADLSPSLLACANFTAETTKVEPLLGESFEDKVPNWVQRLNVRISTKIPRVKVTVELFKFGFPVHKFNYRVNRALRAWIEAKGNPFWTGGIFELKSQEAIDGAFGTELVSFTRKLGIPTTLQAEEYWRYAILVYAQFPPEVTRYIRPMGNQVVDKFEFDKSAVRDVHLPIITSAARDIVESWKGHKVVTHVVLEGHTDEVGTAQYNEKLGLERAKAVGAQLQEALDKVAPAYMKGAMQRGIKFDAVTFGKTRPVSKTKPELNRRVQIKLGFTSVASPPDLPLNDAITRARALLRGRNSLDGEAVKRLTCLLSKMYDVSTDDRWVPVPTSKYQRFPEPYEWSRVRDDLSNARNYGPGVSNDVVLKSLEALDRKIIEGVLEVNRLKQYYSGVQDGWGLKAIPGVNRVGLWLYKQLTENNASIYSCYRALLT